MSDARFADGAEEALALKAEGAEDLPVISAMIQDAVGQVSEMRWIPKQHRLAFLLNRFRWEDADEAAAQSRPYERVQSVLVIDGALKVSSSGIDRNDQELVFSLLSLEFTPGEDGAGRMMLTLAGDGEIAVDVETIDVILKDVSRPYKARAKALPRHSEDG
ncbi:DUF2948 family protein [Paracoccaceae bacterium GXU_MW_L88]